MLQHLKYHSKTAFKRAYSKCVPKPVENKAENTENTNGQKITISKWTEKTTTHRTKKKLLK